MYRAFQQASMHYPYTFHPHLYYPVYLREFPEVNPNQFIHSAKNSLDLLTDAQLLLNKINSSNVFSKNMMQAAQMSHTEEVDKLIQTTGIKTRPKISYNPDGITFTFDHKSTPPHCCLLSIQLKWR